ncbi:helix-turn-helix domain-containing protein [Glycomyces tenuis]|uniref:helix-turn-helix domain-containing protein n=1 Tax=Glycomyces tenuis TaxID=58116 RepID=UPI0004786A90|nr:helix-turn-helix transcriptional regulator [Glycomyces tenuis]
MPTLPGPGPSLRSQWLGERIRDLRKSRRMSLKEVGSYLQRDQATLSRYENGELPVRRGDLMAMLDLFGVSDPKMRGDLEQMRDDCWQKDWWDQHREDLGSQFINMPWLESRAERICSYQTMFVDGLLQTREQAEVLIRNAESAETSEQQIERWVDLRIDRQRVLTGQDPTRLSVILEETVLHRRMGGPRIWHDQLQRLLGESERDNVEVRVMPFSRAPHAGHQGSFILFEMPEPYPEVAYVDTLAGILYVEDPSVHRFSQAWQDLYEGALSPEASIQLIAEHLEGT